MTDISIDDVLLFSRVAPHFELTVELYARLVDDGGSAFTGIYSVYLLKFLIFKPLQKCEFD